MHKNTNIWARDLVIGYGGEPLSRPLRFSIEKGSWITFYGTNGQGKTTLLKTLCGIIHPLEGTCGIQPHFFMGTTRPFYPALRVRDNLQAFARYYQKKLKLDLQEFWGLGELWDEPFHTLSDGEKQRCHLALGQLIDSSLWVADEPFLSLDSHWTTHTIHFFKRYVQGGGTLLMAQHAAGPEGKSIQISPEGNTR